MSNNIEELQAKIEELNLELINLEELNYNLSFKLEEQEDDRKHFYIKHDELLQKYKIATDYVEELESNIERLELSLLSIDPEKIKIKNEKLNMPHLKYVVNK